MATTEAPVETAAPVDVAQQAPDTTVTEGQKPDTTVEITDLLTFLNSPEDAASKPVETTAEVDKEVPVPEVRFETAAEETPAPVGATTKEGATDEGTAAVQEEKEKAGFLASLKKGLSIALVPKPSLDNADEGKDKKKDAKPVPEVPTEAAAVETSAEGTGVAAPEDTEAATAPSGPMPPTRKSSFAAFKQRVSSKIAAPGASPSSTPTKKGAGAVSPLTTESPPASPRKSTSAKVHELADNATTKVEEAAAHLKRNIDHVTSKAKEGVTKADQVAIQANEGAHKKVDHLKEKAEAFGKKIEGAFHHKKVSPKSSDTEGQTTTAQEATTQTSADTAPAVEPSVAGENATPVAEGAPATPAKTENRFKNLKKRFSLSAHSKTAGEKDGETASAEEEGVKAPAKEAESANATESTATVVATTEVSHSPKRKPSMFTAFTEHKEYLEHRLSANKYDKTNRMASSQSGSAEVKAKPMDPEVTPSFEQAKNATDATDPYATSISTQKAPQTEAVSPPASPAPGVTTAKSSPFSFASKVIDKSKEQIKAGKNRLSLDFGRPGKKDKEDKDKENGAKGTVVVEEEEKATVLPPVVATEGATGSLVAPAEGVESAPVTEEAQTIVAVEVKSEAQESK